MVLKNKKVFEDESLCNDIKREENIFNEAHCVFLFASLVLYLGKDSFEKEVVKFHNFGPSPPPWML